MTTEVRTIASGFRFLEGPRWHGGSLYASDMFGREVLKFDADGNAESLCQVPTRPSGLAWDSNGHLLIASMSDKRILRLRGEDLEVFADLSDVVPGDVNDMISDGKGGIYIGNFGFGPGEDMGPTRLVHVSTDGTVKTVADGLVFPNGMAITPDGTTLLVAETFAFRISAFDIGDEGLLTNRRDWASFQEAPAVIDSAAAVESGVPIPDGICLDAEGAAWVADAGGNGALRVAPGGKIIDEITTPGLSVFAVALGGQDRTTLFMCAAPKLGTVDLEVERQGRLLASEVEVPGA